MLGAAHAALTYQFLFKQGSSKVIDKSSMMTREQGEVSEKEQESDQSGQNFELQNCKFVMRNAMAS